MLEEIAQSTEERMNKTVEALRRDLGSVRAGRATPAMLDKVTVEYYGSQMPVNQVASVTSPEPRMLTIAPWDKSMLVEIEKAIQRSDLGLNPNNDGSVIRLVIPAPTDQRRQELVKQVRRIAEEARIGIRNVRRDANEDLKKAEKSGDVSEDDVHREMEKVQAQTDRHIAEIDRMSTAKEHDVLEI